MDSVPQQMLLQVILILLNAFFASTEIAVLSLNTAKLKKLADEGDRKAKRLVNLVKEPSLFLSTIQIGITLAGFLGSAFAADNFSGYLVQWIYYDIGFTSVSLASLKTFSVIIITLILSYFTLVFGELVPKRIAMQKPYEIAKFSSGIVSGVAFVMRPFVLFLSFSTNITLKLLGMKTEAEDESVTEEEIQFLVELGGEKGVIDEDESEWIQNVFAFNDILVKEIMTHDIDIISFPVASTEEEIIQIITSSGLSRFPVYGKDLNDILGILYTKDYLLADKETREDLQSLLRPIYFVPENILANDLFSDMQRSKVHFAVVIDEFGAVSGIITMEDLLEEIVGNIYDEHDFTEDNFLEQITDTTWRVSGECDIEDLAEEVDEYFEINQEYDTVGGLIYSRLRTIPKDGSTFDLEIGDYIFHVREVDQRRIKEVIIERIKKESKEEPLEENN